MAPSAPVVVALIRLSSANVDEQSMLLQMPVVEKTVETDALDCHCPGFFEQQCLDNAFQGCRWTSEDLGHHSQGWTDRGQSNGAWCQCDPNFVPTPPLFNSGNSPSAPVVPLPPVVAPVVYPDPRYIRPIDGTAIYWEVSGVKYYVRSCSMCDDTLPFENTPCHNHWVNVEQSYIDSLPDGVQFECTQHPQYTRPPWQLIAHHDYASGFFPADARNSFLVNADTPDAGTFMNIGNLNNLEYLRDEKYLLKLVYTGVSEAAGNCNDGAALSDATQEFEWTQSSWITDPGVTGYEAVTEGNLDASPETGCVFTGVARSSTAATVLDGSHNHGNWFHSIGSTQAWHNGIPAFKGGSAQSMSLYIHIGSTPPEEVQAPPATCPDGWSQRGVHGADIGGCGLTGCEPRYTTSSEAECAMWCDGNSACVGFSYAPMNGDRNHARVTTCTLYNSDIPTGVWTGTQGVATQVMCGRAPEWELIAHHDFSQGFFPADARNSYLVNADTPGAGTFMNIGTLNQNDFMMDGKYLLRLVYTGVDEAAGNCNDGAALSDATQEFEWTQTSWITDASTTGYEVVTDNNLDYSPETGCVFSGVARSSTSATVLDGSHSHGNWFHSIGSTQAWHSGIPAFKGGSAQSMSLYIGRPRSCEDWSVEYSGRCYAVIDMTPPDSNLPEAPESCTTDLAQMPEGYSVVEFSADVQANVAIQHSFGTWRVVYANGESYATGTSGTCGRCNCDSCNVPDNLVAGENNDYSVSSCAVWAKVFISKPL